MTKQDVIDALKFYGGKATQTQITHYLKTQKNHSGYCSANLHRLKAWHQVTVERIPREGGGAKENLWILNEDGRY